MRIRALLMTLILLASFCASAAVINSDDRRIRDTVGAEFEPFEAAQGRLWCATYAKIPRKTPTKSLFVGGGFGSENATLFLDKDLILVNRHAFMGPAAIANKQLNNCWFEHIQTGQIIPLTKKVAYLAPTGDSFVEGSIRDIAIARLKHEVSGGAPIEFKDLAINVPPDAGRPMFVLSNYAADFEPRTALTITTCQVRTLLSFHGQPIFTVATDCDSGSGSSGAQAYIHTPDGQLKLYGLITGEIKNSKNGSDYDPRNLSTLIVTFESYIMDLYHQVRATVPIPTTAAQN